MLCRHPFVRDPSGRIFKRVLLAGGEHEDMLPGVPFPCGQCLSCRINRRRYWTCRLLLESLDHEKSIFLTLTYDDEHLPEKSELVKRDVQLFIKRLRKRIEPVKIRYYACGEYGSLKHRPHYHLIIFGIDFMDPAFYGEIWPFGFVYAGECNRHTIQYVAGYVTKKFVKKSDGIQREFTLCSRRPGLGYGSIERLFTIISSRKYSHLFPGSNFPLTMRFDGVSLPFDRFIRDKLYKMTETEPDYSFVGDLCKRYFKELHNFDSPVVDSLILESRQRNIQIEARQKIFDRRSDL